MGRPSGWLAWLAVVAAIVPGTARASLFQGEALDKVANGTSWLVLIVAPIVAIGVFWLVHIIPEKIAERRHHPQAKAIQALCLLSLVFGGLLWPIALLWAVTKPVLHKAAYGYDYDTPAPTPASDAKAPGTPAPDAVQGRAPTATASARPAVHSAPASARPPPVEPTLAPAPDDLSRMQAEIDRLQRQTQPLMDEVRELRSRVAALDADALARTTAAPMNHPLPVAPAEPGLTNTIAGPDKR